MNICRLEADVDNYANFTSIPKMSLQQVQSFNGTSKADRWKPLELVCIDKVSCSIGDAMGFDFGVIFRADAVSIFRELCGSAVEFLPVTFQGNEFYIPNVLGTLDCLDHEKSKCLYSRNDPERVLMVHKYVFDESRVTQNVFRLKDEPLRAAFITEPVVDAIRKANLKGFRFDMVWDGDPNSKCTFDGVIRKEYL